MQPRSSMGRSARRQACPAQEVTLTWAFMSCLPPAQPAVVSLSPGQASGRAGANALRHLLGPREDSVPGFQAAPGGSELTATRSGTGSPVCTHGPARLTLGGSAKLAQDMESNGVTLDSVYPRGAGSLEATPGFRRVQGNGPLLWFVAALALEEMGEAEAPPSRGGGCTVNRSS